MAMETQKKAVCEQNFVSKIIKRLVMAWDSDFTKLTLAERKDLEEAMSDRETVSHDSINWD